MIDQPKFNATSCSSSLKESIGTSHSYQYNSPKLLKKRTYNFRSNKDRQKRRNAKRLGTIINGYESDTTVVIKSDLMLPAGKATETASGKEADVVRAAGKAALPSCITAFYSTFIFYLDDDVLLGAGKATETASGKEADVVRAAGKAALYTIDPVCPSTFIFYLDDDAYGRETNSNDMLQTLPFRKRSRSVVEELQELEWLGLSDDPIAKRNLFDYRYFKKLKVFERDIIFHSDGTKTFRK